jgi:calcium binding protein 39
MAPGIFARLRVKNPAELAAKAHQAFLRLPYESSQDRTVEEISRLLAGMKELMFGEGELCNKDSAMLIVKEACKTELVTELVECLSMLDFETRKDVAQVFGSILRVEDVVESDGTVCCPGKDYVLSHMDILSTLFDGFSSVEISFNCQDMFRECIRHEEIAKYVLESQDMFPELFEKLHDTEFEMASDAFTTFKDLLTRHQKMAASYLIENYEWFFSEYSKLLESTNYFTRRQSVKLLGELLLERSNVRVLVKYVADAENLKVMMNLLKSSAKSIQWEAFHVFKVFVANPNKSPAVLDILIRNKDKLLQYFESFQSDRTDEQFLEEKAVIIQEISLLHENDKQSDE